MGQTSSCECRSGCSGQGPAETVPVKAHRIEVKSLVLPVDTDARSIQAHQLMIAAVEARERGEITSAFKSLAAAETQLARARLPPPDLRRAFDHDPALASLRQELKDMETCLDKAAVANPEDLQESIQRAAEDLLEDADRDRVGQLVDSATYSLATTGGGRGGTGIEEPSPVNQAVRRLSLRAGPAEMQQVGGAPSGKPGKPQRTSVVIVSALDKLDQAVGVIQDLCSKAQVFEAAKELEKLDLDIASNYQVAVTAGRPDLLDLVCQFRSRIAEMPMIGKLRKVFERLDKQRSLISSLSLVPDNAWSCCEIKEPGISDTFRIEVKMRILSAAEKDPAGPSTQLAMLAFMHNVVGPLAFQVAQDREVDLVPLAGMLNATHLSGAVGGPDELMSAMLHVVLKMAPLPIQIDSCCVKEYAVCTESVIPGYPPGCMIFDQSFTKDVTEFENWKFPAPAKGSTRNSEETVRYAYPSEEMPGTTTVVMASKSGVSLPSWMIPLSLVKQLIGSNFGPMMLSSKTEIWDKREELGFPERMAKGEGADMYEVLDSIAKRAESGGASLRKAA